jgi:hypothetical protein
VLKAIKGSEAVVWKRDRELVPQPTWGFYVFLTAYDQATRECVLRAMENWVELVRRIQGAGEELRDPYGDEAFRRFRMDLVEERESLENASSDRVRACFRALVRSFEITDNDNEEDLWVPLTRNKVCFVLDTEKVQMLADLTFSDNEDDMDIYGRYEECFVQAVDIGWQRPEVTSSMYRGVKDACIVSLARAYSQFIDGLGGYDE